MGDESQATKNASVVSEFILQAQTFKTGVWNCTPHVGLQLPISLSINTSGEVGQGSVKVCIVKMHQQSQSGVPTGGFALH